MADLDLLTIDEAATLARTAPGTIRDWIGDGRLRSYRPGKRRLIDRADLIAFIRAAVKERK